MFLFMFSVPVHGLSKNVGLAFAMKFHLVAVTLLPVMHVEINFYGQMVQHQATPYGVMGSQI